MIANHVISASEANSQEHTDISESVPQRGHSQAVCTNKPAVMGKGFQSVLAKKQFL